jgi:small subunit ribosomal protein S8
MIADPVANFICVINNVIHNPRQKITSTFPYTTYLKNITDVLLKSGYLKKVEILNDGEAKKLIKISLQNLKENNKTMFAIHEIKQVSKPSLRIYKRYQDLPYVANGLGICVVSTSKGVMTDKDARTQKIGGEIIAKI